MKIEVDENPDYDSELQIGFQWSVEGRYWKVQNP